MYTININLPGGEFDFTALKQGVDEMALNLSNLQAEVERQSSVIASATTLLGQLAQEIRDNATDQTALNELANRLDQNTDALGEAVAANTEADDEVEGEVTPVVGEESTGNEA